MLIDDYFCLMDIVDPMFNEVCTDDSHVVCYLGISLSFLIVLLCIINKSIELLSITCRILCKLQSLKLYFFKICGYIRGKFKR